ncbi:cyclin-domain-containing protein [Rickenella mellea]|uniref:Cyclin-domain-containing protein n=1 Tax=Rickenella mellea TaxID=50990 RepID=A0A4R5XGA1_9AGAM|nr:cyclin-domain-containing protein [Rickenella mellea]
MLALAPSLQSHSSHNTAVSKSASRSKPSRRPNSSSASASASSSSSSFPSSSSTAPPATATAPPTRPPAVASNSQPGPSAPLRRETVRQDSSCPPIQPPQPQQQPQHAPPPPTVDPTPSSDTPPTAFDIHAYPTNDLLRLLALLLNQIATANDSLSPQSMMQSASDASPSMSRTSSATTTDHPPIWYTLTTASRSALSSPTSHLTFHARNVPSISLESYLLRILRYCPTTNEVFLSLLVYFDRMSKLAQEATGSRFAIDSYNVHRLVIAGVTVASKFFSDVFYTNSRYAKASVCALSLILVSFLFRCSGNFIFLIA